MKSFFRSRFHILNRWMSKLPGFSKDVHSLSFLNGAQFLGVLNDNIFKLVLVFLLIEMLGQDKASSILSAVGAIYVIPFLLFSSAAGILADRFSKQRLLVGMKAAEIMIMALALVAFGMRSEWASYTLLFLLATHSALFGPSKYGIIPELVSKEGVSKANGLVTAFTYLAMILGTFLASFLTDITEYNFVLIAGVCLFVAILGFISAFGIRRTPAQGSDKKLNPFFISEIYQTLCFCRQKKHLLSAIFGSSFFLFLGAYTQLNIIPYAMQSLGLTDVAGGYLFLSTALGIAFGSFLAGKASRKRIELGLPCVAGFVMAILLVFLTLFSHHLFVVIFCLTLLGICGGTFIVPFDSFLQVSSPNEKRGQVIAAANFLSFAGVLLASFCLFFFSQVLEIASATGFAVMGGITFLVSLVFTVRLSDLSFSYFSRKILKAFYKTRVERMDLVEKYPNALILFPEATKFDVLLLLSVFPDARLFIIEKKPSFWSRVLYNLTSLPSEESIENYPAYLKENERGCVLLKGGEMPVSTGKSRSIKDFFIEATPSLLYVKIKHTPRNATVVFSETVI